MIKLEIIIVQYTQIGYFNNSKYYQLENNNQNINIFFNNLF